MRAVDRETSVSKVDGPVYDDNDDVKSLRAQWQRLVSAIASPVVLCPSLLSVNPI